MNIAFFCDTYLPTKNGVVTSAHTTALELRARGHRVVVFAPRFTDHEDDTDDVVRFAAGHWFKAPDYPVTFPFICRIAPLTAMRFRRERFDVVHAHSPFIMGNLGAHWAQFHELPLVWTFHTLYHHYAHYSITSEKQSRWYILWRVKRMLEKSDRVIAPSNAVERVIQKLAPQTSTQVLPTGVDTRKFASGNRDATRAKLGIKPDEVALLYVGRIAPEKNLEFLMRAVAPILTGQKAKLLMVGGGPDMDAMRSYAARLGIGARVIYTDFIEPEEMPNYFAAADIFTFASRTETQGLSIAEALCAGLPCVVVNAMGAAEAIEPEGDGFLVPHNEARFREAVARLVCEPPLRARFKKRALERAPEFSKERRVGQLLDLYGDVVALNSERNERERFEMV